MVKFETEPYLQQVCRWPTEGRHVLADFDNDSIVVYQAYCPEIAADAVRHQQLGGSGFSFDRMSWIKPSFLWMMYRSGWGTKASQEATLALRIRRQFFDELLATAVASSFQPHFHGSKKSWRVKLDESDVRLQWDPDHHPDGRPLPRRAIQLGLRGAALRRLATSDLLEVSDLSAFVAAQRPHPHEPLDRLLMPTEWLYWPRNIYAAANACLDPTLVR